MASDLLNPGVSERINLGAIDWQYLSDTGKAWLDKHHPE